LLALIGVLWSFGGWHHASYLAGEAIDAQRTVPRAMILGAVIVTLTYVLVNITWVFFRAEDFATAWRMIDTMLTFDMDGQVVLPTILMLQTVVTIGIMLVCHWYMRNRKLDQVIGALPAWFVGLGWGVLITLIVITQGGSDAFIYFQF